MVSTERKEALLNAIQKLEAYRQIQNEMGRAVAAFNFRQADRLLSFFALENEQVSLEYADEGVFNGPEAVKTIIHEVVGTPPRPGEMLDMQLTTPIIEIAEDLQSAKCVWWMPGAGAIPLGRAGGDIHLYCRGLEDIKASLFPLHEMRLQEGLGGRYQYD